MAVTCTRSRMVLAFYYLFICAACALPSDSSRALDRIRGGVMRVGVVANDPWVIDTGLKVDGIEGRLVAALAAVMDARVEWVRKPEFQLMRALRDREVD